MTEFMADDNLSMNRVNPYTATGTFGIPDNGGNYMYGDMKWKAPVESQASWDLTTDKGEFADHFNPMHLNRSGSMYLKTASVDPANSFMFPARKTQYDDGTTNWSRKIIWKNGENYTNENPFGRTESFFPIFIMLVLLLLLFIAAKILKV